MTDVRGVPRRVVHPAVAVIFSLAHSNSGMPREGRGHFARYGDRDDALQAHHPASSALTVEKNNSVRAWRAAELCWLREQLHAHLLPRGPRGPAPYRQHVPVAPHPRLLSCCLVSDQPHHGKSALCTFWACAGELLSAGCNAAPDSILSIITTAERLVCFAVFANKPRVTILLGHLHPIIQPG